MTLSRPNLVVILAFEDMEVLDFAGPYEVFNLARELTTPAAFEVVSVAVDRGLVTGRGEFTVLPPHTLDSCPDPDIVVVPGGAGSRALLRDRRLLEWLTHRSSEAAIVASVCTGALILAAAGLLEDRPATTHHSAFDELVALSPTTTLVDDQRFVRSADRIWTSGGISAGIDLALHLVRLLAGEQAHAAVVTEMEWNWRRRD